MGQIKKIGNEYYIEFYARGLLYQQKAGTDQGSAERLLHDIEEKIAQGEAATIVRDVDVDIFLKTFLEDAATQHTPKTLKRYKTLVQDFTKFLLKKNPKIEKLSSVTPRLIDEYRFYFLEHKPPIRPEVINFSLFLLRDIFDYSIKLGYLNDNPTFHVKFFKQEYPRVLNQRAELAKDFIDRGVSFPKLYRLLELDDIAKTICYIPFYFERKI